VPRTDCAEHGVLRITVPWASGHFAVEPSHTQVAFGISHTGFATYFGRFTDASGTLDLEPAKVAASKLDVTVPTATISTTSDKLNEELRSAQWLDAAKYPTISFHATKVVRTGPSEARIEGDLTLHGVTKPVTLVAHVNGAGTNPLERAAVELNVPEGHRVELAIAIGRPGERSSLPEALQGREFPSGRKPVAAFAFEGSFAAPA
jgi:polyisoprenoid-binding protein YceI